MRPHLDQTGGRLGRGTGLSGHMGEAGLLAQRIPRSDLSTPAFLLGDWASRQAPLSVRQRQPILRGHWGVSNSADISGESSGAGHQVGGS